MLLFHNALFQGGVFGDNFEIIYLFFYKTYVVGSY